LIDAASMKASATGSVASASGSAASASQEKDVVFVAGSTGKVGSRLVRSAVLFF
jgi:hypothetical protein